MSLKPALFKKPIFASIVYGSKTLLKEISLFKIFTGDNPDLV